jgi:hypothetical protein
MVGFFQIFKCQVMNKNLSLITSISFGKSSIILVHKLLTQRLQISKLAAVRFAMADISIISYITWDDGVSQ